MSPRAAAPPLPSPSSVRPISMMLRGWRRLLTPAACPVSALRRTPTFSKHQGQLCGGVHLHVLDADAVRPLSAGLTLLELIRDTCPNDFALLPPHTEGGRPFISLLAGHRELERPDWTAAELIKAQAPDEAAFAARKAAYHLY